MGGVAKAFPGRAGALPSPPAALVMGSTTSFVEHAAATSTAGVIVDEDILAVHDAMKFHLGGRSW
jgi:hypothetical protein